MPRFYAMLATACVLLFTACNQSGTGSSDNEDVAATENSSDLEPLTTETAVAALKEYAKDNPDSIAVISTRLGDIKVRLYQNTPLHRTNFVRLAKAGFYDQGEFYRVIKGFAIQGGDSDDRKIKQGAYKIPQEIRPEHIHKKGALAMARYGDERNPEKESSSHNFYIVQGQPLTDAELSAIQSQRQIKYTPAQLEIYKTVGGEPALDREYTVFGEVIEGQDIVDKIADEPVESGNWPKELVKHTIKITNQ